MVATTNNWMQNGMVPSPPPKASDAQRKQFSLQNRHYFNALSYTANRPATVGAYSRSNPNPFLPNVHTDPAFSARMSNRETVGNKFLSHTAYPHIPRTPDRPLSRNSKSQTARHSDHTTGAAIYNHSTTQGQFCGTKRSTGLYRGEVLEHKIQHAYKNMARFNCSSPYGPNRKQSYITGFVENRLRTIGPRTT